MKFIAGVKMFTNGVYLKCSVNSDVIACFGFAIFESRCAERVAGLIKAHHLVIAIVYQNCMAEQLSTMTNNPIPAAYQGLTPHKRLLAVNFQNFIRNAFNNTCALRSKVVNRSLFLIDLGNRPSPRMQKHERDGGAIRELASSPSTQ